MTRETADEINNAAGLWAVRAERGLSEAEEAEFQAWIVTDPRRMGAFGRMTALLDRTERAAALGDTFDPAVFEQLAPRGMSRRAWLAGGGAIAASVAGLGIFATVGGRQTYRTSRGGKQVVALDDGSVATLNTETVVTVSYSKERRFIDLKGGEALFDVAKDASRPFIVRAGDTSVRAVGTSFTVSRLKDAPVSVLVREGVVAVSRRTGEARPATRVTANSRAVAAAQANTIEVAAVDAGTVSRELAWQAGRIIVEGETLAAAAARFQRYSDTRIVIDDPVLAREEISGVFDAGDPVMFAKAMAVSLGARVEVGAAEVRITR